MISLKHDTNLYYERELFIDGKVNPSTVKRWAEFHESGTLLHIQILMIELAKDADFSFNDLYDQYIEVLYSLDNHVYGCQLLWQLLMIT